jgi:hypothetical protein
MVSPIEWGPNAWQLLHGIAERVGNHHILTIQRDEQNALKNVLKTLWGLLPCKTCQDHYRDWIRKNPPEAFTSKAGGYLQDDMRTWVFNLHEAVNERNAITRDLEGDQDLSKIVPKFNPEMLQSTYATVNLRECASNLKSVYQRGIQTGVLKPEEWKAAWRHLDLLLRFIGV